MSGTTDMEEKMAWFIETEDISVEWEVAQLFRIKLL